MLLNHFPYEGLVHLLTPGPMCHKSSSSFQRNNQGISHLSPSRFEAPNVILPIANVETSTRPRLRKTMDEAGCAQSKADGGGPRCAKLWRKVENADLTRGKFSTTPSLFIIGKFSSTKTLKRWVKKKMGNHWLGVLAVIELISVHQKNMFLSIQPGEFNQVFLGIFFRDTTSQTLEKPDLAVNQQIAGDLKIPDFFLLKYHSN